MSRSRLLSLGFRCETRSKLVDQRLHRDAVAVELAVHPHFVGLRQFTEPICQLPVELLRARNQVRVVLEQCDRTMQHLKRLSVSVGSAADSVTCLLRQQLLDRALPVRDIVGVPKCFGAVLAIGAWNLSADKHPGVLRDGFEVLGELCSEFSQHSLFMRCLCTGFQTLADLTELRRDRSVIYSPNS